MPDANIEAGSYLIHIFNVCETKTSNQVDFASYQYIFCIDITMVFTDTETDQLFDFNHSSLSASNTANSISVRFKLNVNKKAQISALFENRIVEMGDAMSSGYTSPNFLSSGNTTPN